MAYSSCRNSQRALRNVVFTYPPHALSGSRGLRVDLHDPTVGGTGVARHEREDEENGGVQWRKQA